MSSSRRYRVLSVFGTVVLVATMVFLAGVISRHSIVEGLRFVSGLSVETGRPREYALETATATVVVLAVFVPMYKPQPRRILDTAILATRRVFLALTLLATIGYFDYTYRLPRLTVIVAAPLLLVTLPAWFVSIRRRPTAESSRALVVGNDTERIQTVAAEIDTSVVGYVAPPSVAAALDADEATREPSVVTDGSGTTLALDCLGGFSQLEEILVENDIDTAVLAFQESDRQEFFGALDICYDNGVVAKVHRAHAATLLTDGMESGPLVTVTLQPWDWQDRLVKRLFDIAFAVAGLFVLAPVVFTIAAAIKAEDGGSIFYDQERTTTFGETFTVYKFRSMIENAEDETGAKLSAEDAGERDPRVTRVGRVLRRTHMDEIPQLWAILTGHMSVVGPRPERPELDADIREGVEDWHKRWFVKPGLTGLAQINDVTGYEPAEKLKYDTTYVQRQSFWTDLKIVLRQVFEVLTDVRDILSNDRGR